jgi:signal transduction histidine kinase
MERYKKGAIYGILLLFLVTVLATLSEVPLLTGYQQQLFIWTRLTGLLLLLVSAYWLHKDIASQAANVFAGFAMIGYTIHGQLFFPLYSLAFCEVIVFYSFAFPISKKLFRFVVGIGGVAFVFVFCLRWNNFVLQMQHPKFSDHILIILAFAFIAFVSNTFFTSERLFREEAVLKFAKIGTQTSRVVHDLKGLTASPLLYLQVIESKLSPSVGKEVTEAMQLLARDLEGFRKVLFELNQLTASKVIEVEQFSSDDVIGSFQVILKKQLAGIFLKTSGSMLLETDKNLLTSIFLNILMNSVETFKEREVRDPRIEIAVIENRVSFQDNGGGFEKKVLRNISDGRFISTRPNGSGLGLLFVFDGLKRIGGKAKAYNVDGGACVELQFPKKLILTDLDTIKLGNGVPQQV